jgi:hypothetical protein
VCGGGGSHIDTSSHTRKSIRELVLVTNCIYCVLSAFSDNRLVVNHFFISWRILLALLVKSVGLRIVIIMLVSSAYRTTSALSLTTLGKSFMLSKKSNGPSIDACGTLCLISPQSELELRTLLSKSRFLVSTCSVVEGTMLQTGRSRVRYPMRLFF